MPATPSSPPPPWSPEYRRASSAVRFAAAVRALGASARRQGLRAPSFRSPPRLSGVTRTLRHRAHGGAVVAVAVRDRPWPAVLADLVEGVVVANELQGPAAERARAALWADVSPAGDEVAA